MVSLPRLCLGMVGLLLLRGVDGSSTVAFFDVLLLPWL